MVKLVPCTKHGTTAWCYENKDGSHVDSEQCICYRFPSERCPVEAHRLEAQRKKERMNERR